MPAISCWRTARCGPVRADAGNKCRLPLRVARRTSCRGSRFHSAPGRTTDNPCSWRLISFATGRVPARGIEGVRTVGTYLHVPFTRPHENTLSRNNDESLRRQRGCDAMTARPSIRTVDFYLLEAWLELADLWQIHAMAAIQYQAIAARPRFFVLALSFGRTRWHKSPASNRRK